MFVNKICYSSGASKMVFILQYKIESYINPSFLLPIFQNVEDLKLSDFNIISFYTYMKMYLRKAVTLVAKTFL